MCSFLHWLCPYFLPSLGPILGFPVINTDITVSELTFGPATSLAMISSCVSEGMTKALRQAEVQLLEPCTVLEVSVSEDHLGQVLADLSSARRAQIQEVGLQGGSQGERLVTALTPLACLMVNLSCDIEVQINYAFSQYLCGVIV